MWPEALPGFIIIAGCFTLTGIIFRGVDKWMNNGRPRRYNLDSWDRSMMQRDKRLTGSNKQQAL
uniref:NADH dehydrogenase [ubiquinone] 1 alpha subcomplex subunit 1 n=1 Tax=Amphimedon queenslandica TaxID=400682 RepID=A0A1X7TN61_AMPQE